MLGGVVEIIPGAPGDYWSWTFAHSMALLVLNHQLLGYCTEIRFWTKTWL